MRFLMMLAPTVGLLAAFPDAAAAQTGPAADALFTVNNTWMMVATFLVFVMHLGFATLESGLTQSKNTVNILFKNMGIIAIGLLTYTLVGFNLMYPDEFTLGGFLGFTGMGIGTDAAGVTAEYNPGYTYWTDFLFQAMFAATAATIVSGAVAERVKLGSFLLFATIYVMFVYPVVGSWKWGGGWLDGLGFYDFAGSTIVHSVGGWAALAGVIVLGPRLGKYVNGEIRPILGHNLPLAVMGMFLLWLGWFGFNGGSVLSADPGLVSYVLVTTSLAAAAGIVGAMATTWMVHRHPDASMVLNGALAGLVGGDRRRGRGERHGGGHHRPCGGGDRGHLRRDLRPREARRSCRGDLRAPHVRRLGDARRGDLQHGSQPAHPAGGRGGLRRRRLPGRRAHLPPPQEYRRPPGEPRGGTAGSGSRGAQHGSVPGLHDLHGSLRAPTPDGSA